ncbi:DMT family transporter [Brevibacillus panacihumi]|uniref:DMT family transporter n=1 Tax=Brevibacillus panacihumi TaxID=497735 RepID=A0A3M8CST6_9BACL|nr:DMT family transporter [Brevibacillus panacihumi]RNB78862.1 DMT family transporter [Brevibacillus panacihumi]
MKNREGLLFLMLAGVVSIWGLNVVMVKYLTTFPPLFVSSLRMALAAVCFIPIIWAYRKRLRMAKMDWLLLAGIGATSIALHQITMAIGVQYTTAGNGSLILGLNPLATGLLAMLFLGEPMSWRKALGIGIGFSGVLVVVLSQQGGLEVSGWGDAIMFFSMLMYVTGGLLIRKLVMRGVPVLLITALAQVFGMIFLGTVALIDKPVTYYMNLEISHFQWLVILASAVFSSALGTVGWNYGIRQLGASRTSVFLNGMPLASLVFAALFLGERLQLIHVLALCMIVTGVYLGSKKLPQPAAKSAVEATTKA